MRRVFTVSAVALALATAVSGRTLERRAPCVCPAFDEEFNSLAPSSGEVGSVLRCIYPWLSRCQYNKVTALLRHFVATIIESNFAIAFQSDGSLILDRNYGWCRPSSFDGTCPTTDLYSSSLGPGSEIHGAVLYCTYPGPAATELPNTEFYCEYTASSVVAKNRYSQAS